MAGLRHPALGAAALGLALLLGALRAQADAPQCQALTSAANRAATALLSRVEADGRFRYREDAQGQPLPGYNLVRHAGALYALAAHPPSLGEPALQRATTFLAASLRPVPDWPGSSALWSDAEGHPQRAKLGASGLALAAFAALAAAGERAPPLPDLQALGHFIVQMQDDSGRFHMRYVQGVGALRRHSLYYPGEAALGLYRLAALDGDARWVLAADRALRVLAAQRAREGRWPPDHWALIAAAEPLAPQWQAGAREALVTALLAEADGQGALTGDGRSTPTATRLEGLLAALSSPLAAVSRQQASDAVAPALRFLLGLQRPEGTLPAGGAGAMAGEHRIDYTQHALSAFLEALRQGRCLKS